MDNQNIDVLIAGGGLAGSLTAYRLSQLRPDLQVVLIERGERLGGNHTWSFHQTDLTPDQNRWTSPFVTARWPRQEVAFPARRRVFEVAYNSIASEQLDTIVRAELRDRVVTGAAITELDQNGLSLSDGRRLSAPCVIDARGQGKAPDLALGFQKFVGHEVVTAEPHGVQHPMIMDATVPQKDGYRFVYLLPFADDRLLIEDTYYSDGPGLDDAAVGTRIRDYALARGWTVLRTEREERGVLPIALGGDIDAFWQSKPANIAHIGMRAALFHPTTGYSLPDAVAVADRIAASTDFSSNAIAAMVRTLSIGTWNRRRYFRLLNRMLYHAAEPDQRYRVMERFYGLSENLISRFFSDQLTLRDRARILIGKPPVPISRALGALSPGSAWRRMPPGAVDPVDLRK